MLVVAKSIHFTSSICWQFYIAFSLVAKNLATHAVPFVNEALWHFFSVAPAKFLGLSVSITEILLNWNFNFLDVWQSLLILSLYIQPKASHVFHFRLVNMGHAKPQKNSFGLRSSLVLLHQGPAVRSSEMALKITFYAMAGKNMYHSTSSTKHIRL